MQNISKMKFYWSRIRLNMGCTASHAPLRFVSKRIKHKFAVAAKFSDPVESHFEGDIEESAEAIDGIFKKVAQELFLDSAANYVTGQAPTEADLRAAIRGAVVPFIDSLNDTFIPVLNQYIEDSESSKNADIIGVLLGVKREVLTLLAERMPVELRVLQAALDAGTPEERARLLREHVSGVTVPACDVATLLATTGRLLDDTQGRKDNVLTDKSLVAKLCLIREELRQVVDETSMKLSADGGPAANSSNASPYTRIQSIPEQEVSFIKELLNVDSSIRRRALLQAAFDGDNSVCKIAGPGTLLESIRALQTEIMDPNFDQSIKFDEKVLFRLEEVWRETLLVLEDMSGGAKYAP